MAISSAPTVSKEASGSNVTTLTFNIDIPAGDDRILVVGVGLMVSSGAMPTISTVVRGAQSLTKTDGAAADMVIGNTDDTAKSRVEIWKVVAPTTGAANIVITASAVCGVLYAVAHVWTGVDQTTPLGTAATAQTDSASSTTATSTVDVTSATGEKVVDMTIDSFTVGGVAHTITAGSGQTAIQTRADLGSPLAGASYEAGATTVTMSWDFVSSIAAVHNWAIVGVPLKPSTATGDPTSTTTTIAEQGVQELRRGPVGVSFADRYSPASVNHQVTHWEASGYYPNVLVARTDDIDGQEVLIVNTLYTVKSMAFPGAMAVTALPTPNSPQGGSLLVTTADRVVLYPLPIVDNPALIPFPRLTNGTGNDLPAFGYFPARRFKEPRKLGAVTVECRQIVVGTDDVGIAYAWNDGPWSQVVWQSGNEMAFRFSGQGGGTLLRLFIVMYDGLDTESNGPRTLKVQSWTAPTRQIAQPTITTPPRS